MVNALPKSAQPGAKKALQEISTHHPTPALLHRIASSRGLTNEDVAVIDPWLQAT